MSTENLQLKNPQTAAMYETVEPRDYRILSPGLYKGLLSEVPPDVAKIIVEQQKYPRLRLKAQPVSNSTE